MSTLRNTLTGWAGSDVVASRPLRRALAVVGFAALTAFGAKVAIPLPGTPVPFTLQPMFVLMAGAVLGARLGGRSQAVYLLAGIAGLPVFTMGGGAAYLMGPTGGYLMAYPIAAFLAGLGAGRGTGRALLALLAGLVAIYAGGLLWLSVVGTATTAIALGAAPFFLADLVKVGIVLAVARRVAPRAAEMLGR
jgi:biotin transport system substrate-specific component